MTQATILVTDLNELITTRFHNAEKCRGYANPDAAIDYDQDSDYIVVGYKRGPVQTFNNWEDAVAYADTLEYEAIIGIRELRTGQDGQLVEDKYATPWGVVNQGKYPKAQPINPCRTCKNDPRADITGRE